MARFSSVIGPNALLTIPLAFAEVPQLVIDRFWDDGPALIMYNVNWENTLLVERTVNAGLRIDGAAIAEIGRAHV